MKLLNFFCGFLPSPSSECTRPSEAFGFLFFGNYSKPSQPAEIICRQYSLRCFIKLEYK